MARQDGEIIRRMADKRGVSVTEISPALTEEALAAWVRSLSVSGSPWHEPALSLCLTPALVPTPTGCGSNAGQSIAGFDAASKETPPLPQRRRWNDQRSI